MNPLFRICRKLMLLGFVLSLLSFSMQAAELSSIELKKAQHGLLGFEISGRGMRPPLRFTCDGEFPRLEFGAELAASKKNMLGTNTRLPLLLSNAFKREKLSDSELVVALRSARVLTTRMQNPQEQGSGQQGAGGNAK